MNAVQHFLGLSPSQKRLIVRTTLIAGSVRFALWFLPFSVVRKLASRLSGGRPHRQGLRIDRIVWAVDRASRAVPGCNVAVRALTAHTLLKQSGIPSKLHVGIARDRRRSHAAHVWVECNNRIIVGRGESEHYVSELPDDSEPSVST
jgi:hypothetical protein